MMAINLPAKVIFSPRAVCARHGTGVQLGHLIESNVVAIKAINYLFPERGVGDVAEVLESRVVKHWPFKVFGRSSLYRYDSFIPFPYWHQDQLTSRGRTALLKLINEDAFDVPAISIVHDERCAKRMNSIHKEIGIKWDLILYDWMHLDTPSREAFPELTKCVNSANRIFAISPALQRLATIVLDSGKSTQINRIGFYRPISEQLAYRHDWQFADEVKILVLADAKEGPFVELLRVLNEIVRERVERRFHIHFVGNPKHLDKLPEAHVIDRVRISFHGVVKSEHRDKIASSCHLAFLAGPADDPNKCPLSKYSLPSKIGDFAATGLPVIARVGRRSAAAEVINTELRGFVLAATSIQEINESLTKVLDDRNCLKGMSDSALAFAEYNVLLPNALKRSALLNSGD
jgi:hypothetical protein